MSAASIISMPIVNVMPCTAMTTGLRQRRRSANASTPVSPAQRSRSPTRTRRRSAADPAPLSCAVPRTSTTPTHRSGSSSSRVSASDSASNISGVKPFIFVARSTVIVQDVAVALAAHLTIFVGCAHRPLLFWRFDFFFDFAQPILAEIQLRTDEEARRAEHTARDRVVDVRDQLLLHLRQLGAGENRFGRQPGLRRVRP